MQNVFKSVVFFFAGKYYGNVINRLLNGQSIDNYKSLFWLTANDFFDHDFPELVTATGYCWFGGIEQKYHCTSMGLVLVVQDQDLDWMVKHQQVHPETGIQYMPLDATVKAVKEGRLISKTYAQTLERELQEIDKLNSEAERCRARQKARDEVEQILNIHVQNHVDQAAASKAVSSMKSHDFHYSYSDDIEVYRRGQKEREALDAEFQRLGIPIELITRYHTCT